MGNFDKQIQKQGESFSMEPRKEVWLRLKAELDNKRSRRFAWWWFVPIVLATASAALYFFDGKSTKPLPATTVKKQSNAKTLAQQPAIISRAINPSTINNLPAPAQPGINSTSSTSIKATSNNTAVNSIEASIDKTASDYKAINRNKPVTQKKTQNRLPVNNSVTAIPSKQATTPTIYKEKNKLTSGKSLMANQTVLPANSETITTQSANSDLVKENSSGAGKKQTAPAENELVISKPIEDDPKKKITSNSASKGLMEETKQTTLTEKSKHINPGKPKSRVNWKFTLSSGLAINTEAYDFLKFKSKDSNLLGGTGGGSILQPMEKSKPGISVQAGVSRSAWISKRWVWKIAASGQLQQVHQKTGIRYDDPIVPSPDNDYSADYFFESGKEIDHRGNNYRLFLSTSAGYMPFRKLPGFMVLAGINGGGNIFSRYLLPDNNIIWYIRSYDRYTTFFAAANIGTEYNLKNGWSVGVNASHDVTRSFKPLDKRNNYWKSLLINIGIPLQIKK